ncbi:MAG TPA: leucine-rich repeat-containing protein kinase family protein [Aquabacterium sp.]|uniref:leucine-rich repeat-containing protein kinase family protein n=1 Tax=Aquabacterium sp. TaxID=1872578 RepID=UPI002E36A1E0|nr:leucine-rich repeat-containing protein kinase family protein [Aquabacterium sp.]HEX5372064.1 leucine-rich repeat-containing protein kinase family protein [Aquabacterium sp.]
MSLETLARLQSGQLAGAQRLTLRAGLTHFPREIFDLADTLEVLDLSGNALSDLPHDLSRLHRLRVLFCSDNAFTHLPSCLGDCAQLDMVGFKANQIVDVPAAALPPRLRWLILTDNRIAHLPAELGQRPRLEKLMLAGNQLTHLPDTLAQCQQLALLRIAANRFDALPPWLSTLPRLAWLAWAGNPLSLPVESLALSQAQAQRIAPDTVDIGQPLGEGASGVIHAATWHTPTGARPVAIKHFKGLMTSDGLPSSEIAASVRAGTHPHLIGVHGLLAAPASAQVNTRLVMQRIDTGYRSLAGPPSLASCSRDVYADELRLPWANALALLMGMASAATHLHAQGILHGDLYAHNILWDGQGHGLLGDFGAASLLPAAQVDLAPALMRQEVLALGYLMQELLARSTPTPDDTRDTRSAVEGLCARCLQPQVLLRPGMADVADTLRQLTAA